MLTSPIEKHFPPLTEELPALNFMILTARRSVLVPTSLSSISRSSKTRYGHYSRRVHLKYFELTLIKFFSGRPTSASRRQAGFARAMDLIDDHGDYYHLPPQGSDTALPPPHTPHPTQVQPHTHGEIQHLNAQTPATPAGNDTSMTFEETPGPIDPNNPYNGMPPPPSPSTYPTLQALMNACQAHARAHGYACVTSSNNYKRGIAYVRCDRGGHYANHWHLTPETRQRHNRTRRLVGCSWKARAKRLKTGDWELRMMVDRHSGHGASNSAKAHPSLRKLEDGAVEMARRMFGEGKAPKDVLAELRIWNEAVTPQDVYNLKAKIAREDGGDPSTTTAAGGGEASGTAKKSGRKGRGPTSNTNPAGGNVMTVTDAMETSTDPSSGIVVDPLLTAAASGGRAPPAQMQDPATLQANANASGSKQKGKCPCKCCDH